MFPWTGKATFHILLSLSCIKNISTILLGRSYKEDQDPDYKLPEDDKDWLSDLEELDEVKDNLEKEIKCLIEEAEEPAPELHRFG